MVVEHPETSAVAFAPLFCRGSRGLPSSRWDTTSLVACNRQQILSVGMQLVTSQRPNPCRKLCQ